MMKSEVEQTESAFILAIEKDYCFLCIYRQMRTIILPVPPGVRIGATKTTVQVPVDAPTEPTKKRLITLLPDGSGFCKYPKFNL